MCQQRPSRGLHALTLFRHLARVLYTPTIHSDHLPYESCAAQSQVLKKRLVERRSSGGKVFSPVPLLEQAPENLHPTERLPVSVRHSNISRELGAHLGIWSPKGSEVLTANSFLLRFNAAEDGITNTYLTFHSDEVTHRLLSNFSQPPSLSLSFPLQQDMFSVKTVSISLSHSLPLCCPHGDSMFLHQTAV